MFVIFDARQGKYYAYNKKSHWTDVVNKAATFGTEEAARNYAKHALEKTHKEGADLKFLNLGEKQLTAEEAEELYKELVGAIDSLEKIAEKMPALTNYYCNVVSEQDGIQQDILHSIDFGKVVENMLPKVGYMLRVSRLKRRHAKDKIHFIKMVEDNISELHKNSEKYYNWIKNRTYKPRVLPDLFN